MAKFIKIATDSAIGNAGDFVKLAGKFQQTGDVVNGCPCKCGSDVFLMVTLSWTDSDLTKDWLGYCWSNGESRAVCGTYTYNYTFNKLSSVPYGTTGYATGSWSTIITESFIASGGGKLIAKSREQHKLIYKPFQSPQGFGGSFDEKGTFTFTGFGKSWKQKGFSKHTMPESTQQTGTGCTSACSQTTPTANDTIVGNPPYFGVPYCGTGATCTAGGFWDAASPNPHLGAEPPNTQGFTLSNGISVSWARVGGRV